MNKTTSVLLVLISAIPMLAFRHRAVAPPVCTAIVSLNASQPTACYGDRVSITWKASDPTAQVSIPGIGNFLPASGNAFIQILGVTALTALARNACGTGQSVTLTIPLTPMASGSMDGPTSVNQGTAAQFSFTVADAVAWDLSSALGNSFAPTAGAGSGSFFTTYTATTPGNDSVSLRVSNICSEQAFVSRNVQVGTISTPPPPQPPSTGYLRCCDGTFSPTCTSCANKQGCCSHHGGVCGCP